MRLLYGKKGFVGLGVYFILWLIFFLILINGLKFFWVELLEVGYFILFFELLLRFKIGLMFLELNLDILFFCFIFVMLYLLLFFRNVMFLLLF